MLHLYYIKIFFFHNEIYKYKKGLLHGHVCLIIWFYRGRQKIRFSSFKFVDAHASKDLILFKYMLSFNPMKNDNLQSKSCLSSLTQCGTQQCRDEVFFSPHVVSHVERREPRFDSGSLFAWIVSYLVIIHASAMLNSERGSVGQKQSIIREQAWWRIARVHEIESNVA